MIKVFKIYTIIFKFAFTDRFTNTLTYYHSQKQEVALTSFIFLTKDLNSNDYQNEEDLNSKANANEELESVNITDNQHQDL